MERWLNKVLNSLHLEINPRNVDHGLIKNLKINQKNVKKNKQDTKAKVDNILKSPILNITFFRLLFLSEPSLTKVWLGKKRKENMKEKTLTITSNNITQKQWSNLILELNLIKKAWAGYATLNIKAPGIKKIIAHGTRTNFRED